MTIKITDTTPEVSRLQLTKIQDIYGSVMVVKGWE